MPAKLAGEVAALLGLDAFESKAWVESREQIVERLLLGSSKCCWLDSVAPLRCRGLRRSSSSR